MRVLTTLILGLSLLQPLQANDEIIVNGETAAKIRWDDLMPEDYGLSLEELFNSPELDALDDYSPKAQQIMDQMMQTLASAPVVESMDGRMVSIPGFVVPLEGVGDVVDRFFSGTLFRRLYSCAATALQPDHRRALPARHTG